MHQLKGLYGVAYSCSHAGISYCDDWYTLPYKSTYDNQQNKKSLQSVISLGFNNIRTYYLDPNRDHTDFLLACERNNLSVEIGISNNLLDTRNIDQIKKLVNSIKQYKCIKIYTVGNEYFGSLDNIIFGIELLYTLDKTRYIMHSSIFDANFQSASKIYQRVPEYIKPKYIVGINMYFYNNPASQHGDVVQNVVKDYYNNSILKNSYLIISEYGTYDDSFDAIWNFSFGNVECLKKYPNYLGYELFSFTNESWKGNHQGENNYGILTEDGKEKKTFKAIQNFKNTDAFKLNIKNIF
jgi:hypothetical protein